MLRGGEGGAYSGTQCVWFKYTIGLSNNVKPALCYIVLIFASEQMERGVVVTKYGKKGAAAQRVLYLDGASMSVAWRDLDARSPGHRRSTSFTNIIKGKREALALAHLIEVGRFGRLLGRVLGPSCPAAAF